MFYCGKEYQQSGKQRHLLNGMRTWLLHVVVEEKDFIIDTRENTARVMWKSPDSIRPLQKWEERGPRGGTKSQQWWTKKSKRTKREREETKRTHRQNVGYISNQGPGEGKKAPGLERRKGGGRGQGGESWGKPQVLSDRCGKQVLWCANGYQYYFRHLSSMSLGPELTTCFGGDCM